MYTWTPHRDPQLCTHGPLTQTPNCVHMDPSRMDTPTYRICLVGIVGAPVINVVAQTGDEQG